MTIDNAPNGAVALLETLRRWQVRYVFICPGSTEAPFLDASVRYPEIELVLTTHESITVAMADGFARATGEPAVAYLHTNVGLTNGLSHLYSAHVGRNPVVVLTGLKSSAIQNRGGFTTSPYTRDFARPYCKSDWQSLRPEAVAEDLGRALTIATTPPTGPAFLGLSQDLLQHEADVPIPPAPLRAGRDAAPRTRPDPSAVSAAAKILAEAERPLVVAGAEIWRAAALKPLLGLVEDLGAPVMVEDRRNLEVSALPWDHRHYVGSYAADDPAVERADVIFLAGARTFIEFEPPTRPPVPSGARLIHLYSDAADVGRLYPTDVALIGDAGLALDDLQQAMPSTAEDVRALRAEFLQSSVTRREQRDAELDDLARRLRDRRPIAVPALMHTLIEELAKESIVVADAVTSEPFLLDYLRRRTDLEYHTTASGSLGWGMGAALGIKLGAPSRPVVAVLGDGVFQFGIQSLWTASSAGIDVTFIVVNNQSFAAVKSALHRFGGHSAESGRYPATDISGPNISTIAEGFGVPARRVDALDDLPAAVDWAQRRGGPTLVEFMTDPEDIGPAKPRFDRE